MKQDRPFLVEIFSKKNFSEKEIQEIIASFELVEFKKHDYVLKEGQVSQSYLYIEKGLMRSFAINPDGDEITTGFFFTKGLVIEVSSLFLRIPTQENIQAITDCICWRMDFETLQKLFHSIAAFREDRRAQLVGCYHALKQRSLSMVTQTAEARYLNLLKQHPEIIQQAPLKYIASYLGITDTSFSRIRKELSRR